VKGEVEIKESSMNGNDRLQKGRCVTCVSRLAMFLLVFIFSAVLQAAPVFGAELTIPDIKAKPGEDVRVPLVLDQVEHLAGIKIIVNYNRELLIFKGGARSKSTDSMMHVINDKTPGKLIVVMAAARGISGRDVNLLTLFFSLPKAVNGNTETLIEVKEVQLMGDDLKDIPCKAKQGKITISAH
jgi:hypothetical protein